MVDPRPPEHLDLARGLVEDAEADAERSGTTALLQRICRAAARSLSSRGAAIHVVGAAGASGVIASDDWSSQVAELAFAAGEGPSVDALDGGAPVLVEDLRADLRWPGFSETAAALQLVAVLSIPLRSYGVTLGVLELYDGRPRRSGDVALHLGLGFAELAARAVLANEAEGPDGSWQPMVEHRVEVYQAQGMVMVDLGVDLAEAMLRMRAHAFAENLALVDLAQAIIAGFVLPALGGGPGTVPGEGPQA